jgi:hypothetical protein
VGFTTMMLQGCDYRAFRFTVGLATSAQVSPYQLLVGPVIAAWPALAFEFLAFEELGRELIDLSHRGEVDSELLALLVEVAAF